MTAPSGRAGFWSGVSIQNKLSLAYILLLFLFVATCYLFAMRMQEMDGAKTLDIRILGSFILLFGVGLGLLITIGISRHISQPLVNMARLMMQVASGDTSIQVPAQERQDEVGRLAQGLEAFRQTLEQAQAQKQQLLAQQAQLHASNQSLQEHQKRLRESNTQLEKAQDVIRQQVRDVTRASQYKSDFLANMSHELRTPLNSLLILAKGLADNETGNLDAGQVESASVIHESGQHLLTLINDILDLSKIEAGRMDVVRAEMDLAPFMAQMHRHFRHVAADRALGFQVELADGLPQVFASDANRIQQILNNLLSNAFKFTHRGGVTLRLDRPAPDLVLPDSLRGMELLCWSVQDSGIGLSAAAIDRLFQPFEQADSSTSRRYGGTGLGLAISRRLARLLGGDVLVSSEPGRGSCFRLLLPELPVGAIPAAVQEISVPAVQPEATVPASQGLAGLEGRTVLIVDNDMRSVFAISKMLRAGGLTVVVAPDVARALSLLASTKIHLVLVELQQPGMDGQGLIRQIHDSPQWAALPIIAMMRGDGTLDSEARQQLGVGAACPKPIDMDQLAASIRRLLLPE